MPNFDYIINKARSRTLDKNQNYMLIVVGATGSGKSYTALALAQQIDTSFNESRICFTAEKFLENAMKDLNAGSVIMFDEAGIDMSSREWYSTRNKVINQVVETFRRDNLICIWTTPVLKNIDKKSRSYFHGLAIMMNPDKYGWGAIKYFDLEPNVEEGGVLTFYPTVSDKYNRPVSINGGDASKPNMYVPDPRNLPGGESLVKNYEVKKKQFTNDIKERGLEELRKFNKGDDDEKPIKLGSREIIGLIAHNKDKFTDIRNDEIKNTELARRIYTQIQMYYPRFKLSKSSVRNVIGYIRENPVEARDTTENPEKKLNKQDNKRNKFKKEYLPTVMDLREKGFSLHEISDRLNVSFSQMYQEVRKAEAQNN